MDFTIKQAVSEIRVSDLLCSGLEGGIGYWGRIDAYTKPESFEFRVDSDRVYRHIDYPMNKGGSITIEITDGGEIGGVTRFTLNREKLQEGLDVMARDFPKHMADFVGENDDATTGDVFLQCALFGRVIFG